MGMLDRHWRQIKHSTKPEVMGSYPAIDITDAFLLAWQKETLHWSDYTCITSPFPKAWFEVDLKTTPEIGLRSCGWIVESTKIPKETTEKDLIEFTKQVVRKNSATLNVRTDFSLQGKVAGYFQYSRLYLEFPNTFLLMPLIEFYFLDVKGQMIKSTHHGFVEEDAPGSLLTFCHYVYMGLQLFHCKNVHIDSGESKRPAFAYPKKQKKPFVKYKTLVVEPFRKILESEGDIQTNGLKKAMHLCRGHFRTYDITREPFEMMETKGSAVTRIKISLGAAKSEIERLLKNWDEKSRS